MDLSYSAAEERRVGAVVSDGMPAGSAAVGLGAASAAAAAATEAPEGGLEGGGYLRRFDGHKNVMTVKEVCPSEKFAMWFVCGRRLSRTRAHWHLHGLTYVRHA